MGVEQWQSNQLRTIYGHIQACTGRACVLGPNMRSQVLCYCNSCLLLHTQGEGKLFVNFPDEKTEINCPAPSSRVFLKTISENEPTASADSNVDEGTHSEMWVPSGRQFLQQSAAEEHKC